MIRTAKFGALALVLLSSSSCASRDARQTASTTPSRPDQTPAVPRTLYSTGWVDNAGRTSDEHGRPQTSGVRASESGGELPTGTPGSGTPLQVPGGGPTERSGTSGAPSGPSAEDEQGEDGAWVGSLVQALCDHAHACGQVGAGARFGTTAACAAELRPRVREEPASRSCVRGVEGAAACLTAVRRSSCDRKLERASDLPPCTPAALCR